MSKFLTLSFLLHVVAAVVIVFGVPALHFPSVNRISVALLMDAPAGRTNSVATRAPRKHVLAPPQAKTPESPKDVAESTAPKSDHYHADPADQNAVTEGPGTHPAPLSENSAENESTHAHGLIDENSVYLRSVIELVTRAKQYPKISQDREEEGLVLLAVTVSGDGNLKDVRVEQTSPFERLNRAAVDTVRAISKFPPPPGIQSGGLATLHIPIRYKLVRR